MEQETQSGQPIQEEQAQTPSLASTLFASSTSSDGEERAKEVKGEAKEENKAEKKPDQKNPTSVSSKLFGTEDQKALRGQMIIRFTFPKECQKIKYN